MWPFVFRNCIWKSKNDLHYIYTVQTEYLFQKNSLKNILFQETFPDQGHPPEPGGPAAALRVRDEPRFGHLPGRPAQAHPPGALLPLDWCGVGIPHLDIRLHLGKHRCGNYLIWSLNLFFTFQDWDFHSTWRSSPLPPGIIHKSQFRNVWKIKTSEIQSDLQ